MSLNSPPVRLSGRTTHVWQRSYLTYTFLWKNIAAAVGQGLGRLRAQGIARPRVIDVGCGNRPYEDLFEGCDYVAIDRSDEGARPDIIAPADDLAPIPDHSVDLVFSTQVIEHLPDPFAAAREFARVLKPSGVLVISGPFYWPLHEEPYDFFRFTPHGFRVVLERAGLRIDSIEADGGTWTMIGQALAVAIPGWLRPLLLLTNPLFLTIDRLSRRADSPLNYTVVASRNSGVS